MEHPDQPLVLHGVQHLFHPPQRLRAWPDGDRRTRIVFITRDIGRDEIARTFAKFAGARPAA
jgi:G3E family GTPase